MTVIGIISDTHGQLSEAAFAALADSDHIIHAGDIGNPAILRELETLAPVTAVLGNNDFDEYGQAVGRFARPVIDGVRFLVAHYPRDVKISFAGSGALAPGDPIPQVCVHGHTPVSYTHLDVYKRQPLCASPFPIKPFTSQNVKMPPRG